MTRKLQGYRRLPAGFFLLLGGNWRLTTRCDAPVRDLRVAVVWQRWREKRAASHSSERDGSALIPQSIRPPNGTPVGGTDGCETKEALGYHVRNPDRIRNPHRSGYAGSAPRREKAALFRAWPFSAGRGSRCFCGLHAPHPYSGAGHPARAGAQGCPRHRPDRHRQNRCLHPADAFGSGAGPRPRPHAAHAHP